MQEKYIELWKAYKYRILDALVLVTIVSLFHPQVRTFINENEAAFSVILSALLVLLYYSMRSTQIERTNIHEQQTELLEEQASISEMQQKIAEEKSRFMLDVEGVRPDGDNSIEVCVSNHGGAVVTNLQIEITPNFAGSRYEPRTSSVALRKIAEESYRRRGSAIAPRVKKVELEAKVQLALYDTQANDEITRSFPSAMTKMSNDGVGKMGLKIDLFAMDQHENTAEDTLYDLDFEPYNNMPFKEVA